jgi:hypothetical protein
VREQALAGIPKAEIARAYGISRETLYQYLKMGGIGRSKGCWRGLDKCLLGVGYWRGIPELSYQNLAPCESNRTERRPRITSNGPHRPDTAGEDVEK